LGWSCCEHLNATHTMKSCRRWETLSKLHHLSVSLTTTQLPMQKDHLILFCSIHTNVSEIRLESLHSVDQVSPEATLVLVYWVLVWALASRWLTGWTLPSRLPRQSLWKVFRFIPEARTSHPLVHKGVHLVPPQACEEQLPGQRTRVAILARWKWDEMLTRQRGRRNHRGPQNQTDRSTFRWERGKVSYRSAHEIPVISVDYAIPF